MFAAIYNGNEDFIKKLLLAREQRVINQKRLINKYKASLVCYKLNVPGIEKDNLMFRKIFNEGLQEMKKQLRLRNLKLVYEENLYKDSGCESYLCLDYNAKDIKKITVDIEENHELGRLFDFDVLDTSYKKISRIELNFLPRKCFMCNNNAFICSRSMKHPIGELVAFINNLAKKYFDIV